MTASSSNPMNKRSTAAAAPIDIPERTWIVWAIAINVFIGLTRIIALGHNTLDLLPDEAQYWSWSRHLAFGYFSKPPMIAWLIRLTTDLVGSMEWGVRLASPVLQAMTGIVICFIGKQLFGVRTGFWASLLYATLPGVTFSGSLIATDIPLLFFWSLALLAFAHLWARANWGWAAILGFAFGLGFLSKYAMGYFLLGIVVLAVTTPRALFPSIGRHLGLAALVAAMVIAPNIWWNFAHGWATVGHTAANANWGEGGGLHILEALSFAGAQFGVFGPILLIALILRLILWRRDPPPAAERFLLAFAVPVLVLMVLQSGISRAHANWAAVAYVAATLLVTAWLERIRQPWPLRLSLGLHIAILAAFTLIFSGAITVKLPKSADIFYQRRGWKSLANLTSRSMGHMPPGTNIAAEDREVMAELMYNLRDWPFTILMATGNGPPGNQYELEDPVNAENGQSILLISRWKDRTDILDHFATQDLIEQWAVSAGTGRLRHYYVYDLSGFKGH